MIESQNEFVFLQREDSFVKKSEIDKSQIESFLTRMFEDNRIFMFVNGVKKSTDKKYLLTADAVSENIELFAQVLKERI